MCSYFLGFGGLVPIPKEWVRNYTDNCSTHIQKNFPYLEVELKRTRRDIHVVMNEGNVNPGVSECGR